MKIVIWLLGVVLSLVVGIYIVAFTTIGNALVSPMLESKISEETKLDSKLSTFSVGFSDFEVLLELDKDNSIYAKGTYSLVNQTFDVAYDVKLNKLESLKPLTNKDLIGSLFTDGIAKGDMAFMEIDGKSDLAHSTTKYYVSLTDLDPTSIIASIQDAQLDTLLELAGEKAYARGKVNVNIDFKNIKPHELDGTVVLSTKKASLNHLLMSKDFELKIPKTNFSMNLDAILKGDNVTYEYALNSNLAKIKSAGSVVPEPLKLDITYNLDVKELAVLKPLSGQDIRGPLGLTGVAKGSKKEMLVEGKSSIASSKTSFSIDLEDMKPVATEATIKGLKIQKLLYMLKQPHYTNGVFDAKINLSDMREGSLKGSVITSVKKGLLDSSFLSKEYEFATKMPKTFYTLNTNTVLAGDLTESKVNLNSTLISLDVDKAKYNIKDKSIVSDFRANVKDLSKLYFITERKLKGSIAFNGNISKNKDLDLVLHSKVADGKLDAKLFNDDLKVDIDSVQTLKALEMLTYPEVFASSLNGKLAYDLKEKKGTFKGNLVDGKFTQNTMLSLVKQYGNIDLYKQRFIGDVSADINKENLLASFALSSNTSSISTKDTKLNSKEKTIDSKIKIVANKHTILVGLKGNTDAPNVSVDAGDLLKSKVQEAVGAQLNGLLKGFF